MASDLQHFNPPPAPLAPPKADALPVAAGDNRLIRGERKAMEEYRTQMTVITGQAAKTVYAEQMYGKMVQQIHNTVVETLTYIEKTQEETKSTTVRVFCEREKQIYMYQAVEMLTTGGEMLHNEVARSLYPPPKRGWLDY
jgi:hypothetical protein